MTEVKSTKCNGGEFTGHVTNCVQQHIIVMWIYSGSGGRSFPSVRLQLTSDPRDLPLKCAKFFGFASQIDDQYE